MKNHFFRFLRVFSAGLLALVMIFSAPMGFAEDSTIDFSDVPRRAWYFQSVQFVAENGLMTGVSATHFAPEQTLTRAMMVCVLWRLDGKPAAAPSTFADVKPNRYYTAAVGWAQETGIASGVSPTAFAPQQSVTREQMATFLYRYASYKGYVIADSAPLPPLPDAGSISRYARDAVAWAADCDILLGTTIQGVVCFAPRNTATRAQVAAILKRFVDQFSNQ